MEIQLTVRNLTSKLLEQLALTHCVPSGWEIMNYRLAIDSGDTDSQAEDAQSEQKHPYYDYQDIRDDRVLTYFAIEPKESKTFTVRVNKTYDGQFYLPAIGVEAMYDSSIQAIVPGHWLKAISRPSTDSRSNGQTKSLRNF
jgi:uncharacterized protein YfaS (alpha-2-macroglobulin family)